MVLTEDEELLGRYIYIFSPEYMELLLNDGKLTEKMDREKEVTMLRDMLHAALLQYNKKEKIYRNELRLALANILTNALMECSMFFKIEPDDKK